MNQAVSDPQLPRRDDARSERGVGEGAYVLKLRGVSRAYATEAGDLQALNPIDLAVKEGESVSVIGPSGCGKSTLFNIIGGLDPAHEGEVYVDGQLITGPHREIGMVFQEESTFPWRTVKQNVRAVSDRPSLRAASDHLCACSASELRDDAAGKIFPAAGPLIAATTTWRRWKQKQAGTHEQRMRDGDS